MILKYHQGWRDINWHPALADNVRGEAILEETHRLNPAHMIDDPAPRGFCACGQPLTEEEYKGNLFV